MKICLISPINPRDTPYTEETKAGPALGLLRLKHWIESRTEHEVDVIHSDVENPYKVDYNRYDYAGISSYHPTIEHDLAFGMFIKDEFGTTLIYGGINPSFLPEKYLEVGDVVIRWEGEKGLERVLNEEIREGIIDSPELTVSEWRRATLHIPYEQAPWKKIWDFNRTRYGVSEAVRLVTISVCRRSCVFCSSRNFIKSVKYLTAEQLKQLCDRIARFLPREGIIILQGDDELYGKARDRFFELYEHGYRFRRPVSIQTDVNRIDDETARVLKELGVFEVSLGIESFSDNILEEFNKNATVEDNERVLQILLDHGIRPYANIILKGLGIQSNEGDIEYTRQRIEYWREKGVKFGINDGIIPLPGSAYWECYRKSS